MVVAVEEVATVVVEMEDMAEAVMEGAVMGDMEEGVGGEEDTEEVAMVDMAVVAIRTVLWKPMQLVIMHSSNLTSINKLLGPEIWLLGQYCGSLCSLLLCILLT